MMRFLLGVFVGFLIFFLIVWFGGGKTVKKIGEGLTETGRKMEVLEEKIKKGKDDVWEEMKKKFLKEEKEIKKKP